MICKSGGGDPKANFSEKAKTGQALGINIDGRCNERESLETILLEEKDNLGQNGTT